MRTSIVNYREDCHSFGMDSFSVIRPLGLAFPFIQNGQNTLFWLDKWVNNQAPELLCPDLFESTVHLFGTVKELVHMTQAGLVLF